MKQTTHRMEMFTAQIFTLPHNISDLYYLKSNREPFFFVEGGGGGGELYIYIYAKFVYLRNKKELCGLWHAIINHICLPQGIGTTRTAMNLSCSCGPMTKAKKNHHIWDSRTDNKWYIFLKGLNMTANRWWWDQMKISWHEKSIRCNTNLLVKRFKFPYTFTKIVYFIPPP